MSTGSKRLLYLAGVALFLVSGLEVLLRVVAADPYYYRQYRFEFSSANAFQNRGNEIWTYRPDTQVREVAAYGMPSIVGPSPKLTLEYDCQMRSNNLGLLQDNDIAPETRATVVFRDSFTSSQPHVV